MADYCTVDELREWMGASALTFDQRALQAVTSASREIDAWCGRRFWADTSATARTYKPHHDTQTLDIDDAISVSSVTIDGSAVTGLTYRPLNGIQAGIEGWPVTHIERDRTVKWGTDPIVVTATWGWATVPYPVKVACLMLAAETFKAQEAPFGIAGFGADGGAVRVRRNPLVTAKLAPYQKQSLAG